MYSVQGSLLLSFLTKDYASVTIYMCIGTKIETWKYCRVNWDVELHVRQGFIQDFEFGKREWEFLETNLRLNLKHFQCARETTCR